MPPAPRRLEVVLVEHPEFAALDVPRVLGRSTNPDLIAAAELILTEEARRGVAYLRMTKRGEGSE